MNIQEMLGLASPPIAVAFRASAPDELPRVDAPGPSGCSYWARAAGGESFYTEAADHYNCPIGAHTHGVDLPAEKAADLHALVTTMVGLGYLTTDEVPHIPRRTSPFGVAMYGPFPQAPFMPDVVLVRGRAKQVMLLVEAARMAGIGAEIGARLRPTCAILAETMGTGQIGMSFGCIGNRVYTQLGDDELYVAIPGEKVSEIMGKLATIVAANQELERFHQARRAACQR
jgi:uncharacterized protein (DUF169 family)